MVLRRRRTPTDPTIDGRHRLRVRRTRTFIVALTTAMLVAPEATATAAARPTTLCVGHGHGCFATLQAALDASHDSDIIRIGPGTFAGGVNVLRSVRLVGAGAGHTTISGGGPVVTIGAAESTTPPTVSIVGVTITRGLTTTGPFSDYPREIALGGGIEIPYGQDGSVGATVTIVDSVITGNRVAPSATAPIGPPCPGGPCPFSTAQGGGIDNWGTLTLQGTTVSNNSVGGPQTSAAAGAGISSRTGSLTIRHSTIEDNHASALIPTGRFAEGGGIIIHSGTITVTDSRISRNTATMTSRLPTSSGGTMIDMNANSGGIHIGDGIPALVERTAITDNTASADDPLGQPFVFDAGILVGDGPLVMRDSLIARNHLIGRYADMNGLSGSAIDIDGGGTVTRTRIVDNTMTVTSTRGPAAVNGALAANSFDNNPEPLVISDSVISGNLATVSSSTGSATVQGVGIFTNTLLELRHVHVSGNIGKATGVTTLAQGGGIYNSNVPGSGYSGPPGLTMVDTTVTRNSLIVDAGSTVQGAGLFTAAPVTLTDSRITLNTPDQCFGCTPSAQRLASPPTTASRSRSRDRILDFVR